LIESIYKLFQLNLLNSIEEIKNDKYAIKKKIV